MVQDNRDDRKDETEKLRAEAAALLEQARNQLADIQKALSSLGGDRAAHARLSAAADRLSAIVSELSQAVNSRAFPLRGSDLAAIGSAVQSGEASAAMAPAVASPTETSASAAANVATASAETRSETESLAHDVFDRHVFDPCLRYASAEDEAESRKRQAADKKYIADQLARHTPEGNLNASGGMIDSMLDLHAHGAGNSPEFMPRWNALVNKTETQRNAMKAAGQSTDEFDHRLNASVRRFLEKEKGLSETESGKRVGSFANPLDAAKSLLKDNGHSGEAKPEKAPADLHASLHLDDIRAKMEAAGVKLAADNGGESPSHGVNVQKTPAKEAAVLGA